MWKNRAQKESQLPRKLPSKRPSVTHKAIIGGVSVIFSVSEHEDGTPGELFIDTCKMGATIRSLFNCLAIAINIGLKYGAPIEEFVSFFVQTNFEPNGFVRDGEHKIANASSIVDYIFQVIAKDYLNVKFSDQPNQKTELIPKNK
jgi:ribonucleoside-diphosphate reductase alpha chain